MRKYGVTINIRNSLCRFHAAKYRNARGASHQPAFMGDCLGKMGEGCSEGLFRSSISACVQNHTKLVVTIIK